MQAFSTKSVQKMAEQIQAAGAKLVQEPEHSAEFDSLTCVTEDPDG